MKLTFLGSGSAFTVGDGNYQSNMLLESDNGEKLLIDCGTDIRHSLYDVGYSYLDIKDIYISHLHMDHVGGLEYFGFSTKFDKRCSKPNLYLNYSLEEQLWDNILSGAMKTLQGEEVRMDTFFNVKPIENNGGFTWNGVEFKLIQTIHVIYGFSIVPSYGLFFEINGIKIFLTTDTQYTPNQLMHAYKEADIIFHDCEISNGKSYVHAHYEDLKTLPDSIKHKMRLYHYQPKELPNAQEDGFKGFVAKGQEFDFGKPETFGTIYFSVH